MSNAEGGCPDENTLGAFVEGTLGEVETRALEDHVDACSVCQELISAYAGAHGSPVPSGDASTGDATRVGLLQRTRPLSPGTRLGRYVVLGWVGEGGAGTVYAAYDPELDRKVAIKLLHARREREEEGAEAGARAGAGAEDGDPLATKLLREARAMAKLAHPEVVGVHDVGVLGGRVFVAMEFVHGKTLRAWCADRRSTGEILAAYVAAGRGLAAAHSVGLVHRDFKPENVLVGDDGRVRVSDFGLAREVGSGAMPPSSGDPKVAGSLTNPHAGTPAYMAPEQLRGDQVDARTDQYAFCVSLAEALQGTREQPERSIPSRLRKIIARGKSEAPDARYATMNELLAALAADPARRWRRALMGGAVAVAVGSLAFAAFGRHHAPPGPVCTGGERLLTGAWDGARKDAVLAAFAATGKPFATDAWRGSSVALDAYAADWAKTRTAVCEATHVRGEQSAELLDTRMACLDDRLNELRALTDLFVKADAEVVTNALAASDALSRPASCATARMLTQDRTPQGAAAVARAADVRGQLASLKVLADAGKYKDGLDQAARVVELAKASGVRSLEGEALLRYGDLQGRSGDLEGAAATLQRAVLVADAAGDDRTRARAESGLIYFMGFEQAKFAQIEGYRAVAAAAIDRLGGDDRVEGELYRALGAALASQGKLDEARRADERSLALAEKNYGPSSPEAAFAMNNLGLTCLFGGDTPRSIELFNRSLAMAETALGTHHPQIGNMHNNLGLAYAHEGDIDKGAAAFQRALEVYEGALGPVHPRVATALEGIGGLMVERGDFAAAIPVLDRARTIREEHLRPNHPSLFYTHRALGQAYLGLGRGAEALKHLELALSLGEGIGATDLALAEFSLAQAMLAAGKGEKPAREMAEKARTKMTAARTGPDDDKELAKMTAWLASPRRK